MITYDQYMEAREHYLGWCPTCQDFTRDQTEPDARGYDCPVCGGNKVVGVEEGLIEEAFTLK